MPAWLAAALALLRSAALGGAVVGGGLAVQEIANGGEGTPFATPRRAAGTFTAFTDRPRRRRRRRALTASDRADIAFIAGTLGKPAARELAAIIAART